MAFDFPPGIAEEMPSWSLRSTTLIVTDPSHPRRIADEPLPYPLSVKVENARRGTWKASAYMGINETLARVSGFVTWQQETGGPPIIADRTDVTKEVAAVRVDTAQVGVFDHSVYPSGDTGHYADPSSFYAKACMATDGGHRGGTIGCRYGTMGVVIPSGWGDGKYDVQIVRDAGSGDAILVVILFFEDLDDNRLERFARDGAEDGTTISVSVDDSDNSLAMISRDVSYCLIRASEESHHKENVDLEALARLQINEPSTPARGGV